MKDGKTALLVLSGAAQMCQIVEDAVDAGYYVIVTDYLQDSPAKRLAHESWMLSIDDVDGIVEACERAGVDAVMNYCIDPGQKPYQQICERLGIACVGTAEQFDVLTNKDRFKQVCGEYGIDVIETYPLDASLNPDDLSRIEYPVVVKPADGRASKGLSVCASEDELAKAVDLALSCSKTKKLVVERYLKADEVIAKYVVCDGQVFLTSLADAHSGSDDSGMRTYYDAIMYPARCIELFRSSVDPKLRSMIAGLGIRNGALSFSGFVDGDTIRFFDPSFRMGGGQDWRVVAAISGVDVSALLTNFAVSGSMGDPARIAAVDYAFAGKAGGLLQILAGQGSVDCIVGVDEVARLDGVVGYHEPHVVGDVITGQGTVDHVMVRFLLVKDTWEELVGLIEQIQGMYDVLDADGRSILLPAFRAESLLERR